MTTTLISAQTEFASLLGASRVVTDEAACQSFGVDGKLPKFVVYPQSPEQVAALLKCAADHDLAVIPCRGATKLGIGNTPQRYDIALSLKNLNNVWHYEPADLTVSVEPGMRLQDFEHLIGRDRLWLPLDPPGGAHASLGGTLAANASGPLRQFYGSPRDMILGMKVATTEGKIIKMGGRVVKNVAGYDLTKLFIGSLGTLGVIVEANLKLFPLPTGRATFVLQVSSLEAARDLRRRIVNSPLTPMRMVLINSTAQELLSGSSQGDGAAEWSFWIEASGSKLVLDRYQREFEELGRSVGAAVSPLDPDRSERDWRRIADFPSWLAQDFPCLVILKGMLPIASTEDFLNRANREADQAKSRLAIFALPGVGVVHVCLLESLDLPLIAAIENLRQAANQFRGALVVEHCGSEIKGGVDVWGAPGADFEIMRKIKQAWDPKGILAPERFVGSL